MKHTSVFGGNEFESLLQEEIHALKQHLDNQAEQLFAFECENQVLQQQLQEAVQQQRASTGRNSDQ